MLAASEGRPTAWCCGLYFFLASPTLTHTHIHTYTRTHTPPGTRTGGKVSPSAYIDTLTVTEPDLLKVGEEAVIDADAVVMPHALEGESLMYGPVTLEDHARLGGASLVLRNCTIKRGAELAESAVLPPTLNLRVQGIRYGAYVLEEEEEDA